MARDLSLPAEAEGSPDRLHRSDDEADSETEADGELLYRDFIARRLAAAELEQGVRLYNGGEGYYSG